MAFRWMPCGGSVVDGISLACACGGESTAVMGDAPKSV